MYFKNNLKYLMITLIMLITGGGFLSVLIAALFAFIAGPFIYFFLSGFFGGWSKNGLEEFKRSLSVVSVGGKFGKA